MPHKFWPQEGSVWSTWYDLLVGTQLAAARAGFTAEAKAPDARLQWRIDFFPPVELTDGVSGRALQIRDSIKNKDRRVKFDQHLGPFPVFEAGNKIGTALTSSASTVGPLPPPPAPAPAPPASTRLTESLTSLALAYSSLLTAKADFDRLKSKLEAAQKAVDGKKALVEKRRRKVEKVREKEKRKAAPQATASASTSGEKRKQKERTGGKGKKAKGGADGAI
ncbi:hypothetical protein JCM11641_001414 [Rhodosporidiobolus odoratus]